MKMTTSAFAYSLRMTRFLILASILTFSANTPGQSLPQHLAGDVNVEALLRNLRSALGDHSGGVLIELQGSCSATDPEIIVTTKVGWRKPTKGSNPIAILQSALLENQQISIAQGTSGTVTIRDLRVSQDFLETKVRSLVLSHLEQYSPEGAIARILDAEDARQALGELKMSMAPTLLRVRHVNPVGGAHLKHRFRNTSISDFLAAVPAEFGGFVVYKQCRDAQGQRKFDVQYYK